MRLGPASKRLHSAEPAILDRSCFDRSVLSLTSVFHSRNSSQYSSVNAISQSHGGYGVVSRFAPLGRIFRNFFKRGVHEKDLARGHRNAAAFSERFAVKSRIKLGPTKNHAPLARRHNSLAEALGGEGGRIMRGVRPSTSRSLAQKLPLTREKRSARVFLEPNADLIESAFRKCDQESGIMHTNGSRRIFFERVCCPRCGVRRRFTRFVSVGWVLDDRRRCWGVWRMVRPAARAKGSESYAA